MRNTILAVRNEPLREHNLWAFLGIALIIVRVEAMAPAILGVMDREATGLRKELQKWRLRNVEVNPDGCCIVLPDHIGFQEAHCGQDFHHVTGGRYSKLLG